MCTVTFIARKNGFALGMNRDEQLSRATGRPPKIISRNGRKILGPSEPGGGMWIGVNDAGACFALINWYAITAGVAGEPVSRGKMVKAALAADSISTAAKIISAAPLQRVNPFRLLGFFPAEKKIVEWRWDLKKLELRHHRWETGIWISSGFNEPGAQQSRGKFFAAARRQKSAGSLAWLRRWHRSHRPARGAYSTCMHRAGAATVSYTEVVVTAAAARLRHQAGAPCQTSNVTVRRFALAKVAAL